MPDLADRPVAVVGRHIYNNGHAARPIPLERNFLVAHALKLARAALDGPLDVLLRHVLSLGRQDRRAQPRIAVGVAATLGRDADFLDDAGEYLAALGIQRALLVLDCGPL